MYVGVNMVGIPEGRGGGEEVFVRNVLAELARDRRPTRFVVFTDASGQSSYEPHGAQVVDDVRDVASVVKHERTEVLLTPLSAAPTRCPVPVCVLVMDLWTPANNPGGASARSVRRVLQGAASLLAPSKFVQKQLLEEYQVPLDRVTVAPLGVPAALANRQPCLVEKPYLLFVGTTRGYRRVDFLVQAFNKVAKECALTLVVVGPPGDAEPPTWGPRIVRIERAGQSHLASLYQHCALCVCPSIYEGSGVTVLEAMRAGTRVAAGRVGGIAEVAGDYPIYFNPESVESLVRAIRRVLQEGESERRDRVSLGSQFAAQYTWEQCAWHTLAALRRAVQAKQ